MPRSMYFVQECPVCGRPVQVRAVYLGRQVSCQHCGGQFLASDPADPCNRQTGARMGLLDRAQMLLDQSALRLAALRGAA